MNGRHRHGQRSKRVTETSEKVAMMLRIFASYGDRIAEDPAALIHLEDLTIAFRDAVNMGIFRANAGEHGYSQNEIAAMLGRTRQAVQQRIRSGETAYAEIQARRGAGTLARLADVRARRAAQLAAAGVEDRTGSDRERRILRAV